MAAQVGSIAERSTIVTDVSSQVWWGWWSTITTTHAVSDVSDRVLEASDIPFIRPKLIQLRAEGLRPNTRVYPIFDGIAVDAYVRPVTDATFWSGIPTGSTNTYGSVLLTDNSGKFAGEFNLVNDANVQFRVGERIFRLSDVPVTEYLDETSTASAYYTAYGEKQRRQRTIINQISQGMSSWQWACACACACGDPLAQTFFTEGQSGGAYITKVGVFFKTQDNAIPVKLQIRKVVNGYPGAELISSFAEATLYPDPAPTPLNVGSIDIKPSDQCLASPRTATAAVLPESFFVFDRPVYVEEGQEYCFVLLSNSNKYHVWTATMGEFELNSPRTVAKQPSIGSMFISQNNSTWTADQWSDVKFNIYKAEFVIASNGVLQLDAKDAETISLASPESQFVTLNGSPEVRVLYRGHGLFVGSKVVISGMPAGTTYNGIAVANIEGTRTVTYVDSRCFAFTAAANATSTGPVTFESFVFTPNYSMDLGFPSIAEETKQGSSITYQMRTTSGKSTNGTQIPYIKTADWSNVNANANIYFDTPRAVLSTIEKTNSGLNETSVNLRATLSSDNVNLSPFIDLNATNLVAVGNSLDNISLSNNTTPAGVVLFVDETDKLAGYAGSKHVIKPIVLTNPASAIRVIFDANVFTSNYVDVYYKASSVVDDLVNLPWSLIARTSQNTNNATDFLEYTMEKKGISPFTVFVIKLVFGGTNSAMAPRIKNFRTIALAA
jgi:hypothetical protein